MSLFDELKRRNVFRIGIAYLVGSWLLLQIVDVIGPILNLPDEVARYVLFLLAAGFLPALMQNQKPQRTIRFPGAAPKLQVIVRAAQ